MSSTQELEGAPLCCGCCRGGQEGGGTLGGEGDGVAEGSVAVGQATWRARATLEACPRREPIPVAARLLHPHAGWEGAGDKVAVT